MPILCGLLQLTERVCSPEKAPLLPKLRSYFAEFLNEGFLKRLRIFILSTCGGLRYGHTDNSLEVFLGGRESTSSVLADSLSHLGFNEFRICLELTLHA